LYGSFYDSLNASLYDALCALLLWQGFSEWT
jgi:hypothetical protein